MHVRKHLLEHDEAGPLYVLDDESVMRELIAGTLTVFLAFVACRSQRSEVVIFHASSLSSVLSDAADLFRKQNPQARVRLEPSGSQVAARKVSELGMRADIVAVADAQLVDKMMIPSHALWNVVFATNELVIAHKDHSKGTDE